MGFETREVDAIDAEIVTLKSEVDASLLRRYERIASKYDRPLVPIHNGTCYGCFVRYPTAKLAEIGDAPTTCESCGRLLYRIP